MNNQRNLEKLLVEELRKRNALEDVICEYGINLVRTCSCCGKLMNEGWIYRNYETFCSNKCLKKAHPDEDIESLRTHASDEDSETYWTAWEG